MSTEPNNENPSAVDHTPEWWEQREREVAELRSRDAARDERTRMATRAGELRDNGFPKMHVESSLGVLAETKAFAHARMFRQTPKRLLVLAGGVGTGKTTAATWIAMMDQDPRPGFLRISELERRGRYDKKLNEWLKEKTSLVIDDVGAETLDGKGVFCALLDEVIDTFYGNRRTLIMTTNLRPRRKSPDEQEQFFERYGTRAWSRLMQLGMWADCGNVDLRRDPPQGVPR